MGLLRFIVLGAAVAAGVKYATKKRPDGKSFVDDLSEKAPEWIDKAKKYGDQFKDQYTQGKDQFGQGKPTNTDF